MDAFDIVKICGAKLERARMKSIYYPENSEFLWILGLDAIAKIRYAFPLFSSDGVFEHNFEHNIDRFFGVDVEIDYINKDRISLFREEK